MKQFYKALVMTVSAALAGFGSSALAQDNSVILRSFDNNFEVSGDLVSYDADIYRLSTAIGPLDVQRENVECIGAACPPNRDVSGESDGHVSLVAGDGTSFDGTLLEFDGTNYILQTTIGVLTIRSEFVDCIGAACPNNDEAAFHNRVVVLSSNDGTSFEGELVEFDGTNYIIDTTLGILTIRSEFVQCEGAVCPDTGPKAAVFSIASPAGVGELFIGTALGSFAAEKSETVTRSISSDGSQVTYLVGDRSGELIADITVVPANDVASIRALFSGDVAFALTREPFSAEDIASVTNMAVPDVSALLNEETIALDALTAHTHNDNPIRSLSIAQIGDILSGRTTTWAQVGGGNAAINVHVLEATSNLARIIERDILAPRRLRVTASAIVHQTLEELNSAVAKDPRGFTVSYRSDGRNTRIPSTRNACNIFSSADTFSLQTEEYPLTMRWHLYSLKTANNPDYAARLADYLSSDQGQAAAETAGLVSLAITRQPIRNQGERLLSAMLADTISNAGIRQYRSYLAEVSTGYRLSATMRFLTGTSELDARSKKDWERVSRLISGGLMDDNNLILVGFSDSIGNFSNNVSLSRARAEYVKSVVLQENAGVLYSSDVLTLGFGPVAPVGCNVTEAGRRLNRRVEVWIRAENQVPLR